MLKSLIEKILGRVTYFPEEGADIGEISNPDDADILNEDDKDDDNKDDDKDDKDDDADIDENKDEDDKDEDKDDEEEDKDKDDDDKDDDDKEEDEELDRITHASDLKKAYPDIFKKFPDIKAALYRDQRYGEMFSNVEEAENVVKASGILQQIENDLINEGNPTQLLTAIKKDNPESYVKVVRGVFTNAQENDKELYYELAALPIKQLLRAAFRAGNGKEGDLGKAALHIHKYFFENLNLDEKVSLETGNKKEEKSAKEKEYEDKLKEINQREYSDFEASVSSSYVDRMKDVIVSGMKNDDRFTDWSRNKLVEEILLDIKGQMERDPRYQTQIKSLWRQASASKYNKDFKSRIVNAALARAKSLVPAVRAKKISEALGKKKKDDKNKEDKKVVNFDNKNKDRRDRGDRQSNRENKKGSGNPDLDILRNG